MIKTNKSTGKIISVLSAVTALMAMSAAIFASGVLSGSMKDNNTDRIKVDANDNNITTDVYDSENPDKTEWDNNRNKMDNLSKDGGGHTVNVNNITAPDIYDDGGDLDKIEPDAADDYWYKRDTLYKDVNGHTLEVFFSDDGMLEFAIDGLSMYYSHTDKVEYENNWRIYACNDKTTVVYYPGKPAHIEIYDKNGQTLYTAENKIYSVSTLNDLTTVKSFFDAFSKSDFALMKNYCTENCMHFFGDGQVFGMKRAELAEINIDPLEYAKSSNDFRVFMTVNMTPHELSVFDPSDTETSFYVVLLRQPDGRYLIDDFVTG